MSSNLSLHLKIHILKQILCKGNFLLKISILAIFSLVQFIFFYIQIDFGQTVFFQPIIYELRIKFCQEYLPVEALVAKAMNLNSQVFQKGIYNRGSFYCFGNRKLSWKIFISKLSSILIYNNVGGRVRKHSSL